jgi:transposase
MWDKILLRKRHIIETINDLLKNTAQIVHSRHRSINNFIMNLISATIYEHYNEVLNFFVNRSTNAFAEAFNAKVKAFRAQLRGVTDIKFFLFRLITIYA